MSLMAATQDAINRSFAFDFALPWHEAILPDAGRSVKRNSGRARANPGPGITHGRRDSLIHASFPSRANGRNSPIRRLTASQFTILNSFILRTGGIGV
jgi:hypothetical protein